MLHVIKRFIQSCVPNALILWYHKFVSCLAATWYRHPSREMLVIGVTGTNGKSTTCHLIARVLDASGYKVGLATTVEFKIGDKRWINDTKMTMLGRFALQKLLRQMVDENVKYAVIEVSSQGIDQHRASGIDFDIAVLTNLTPEHIEAHGSFEAYKQAKSKLFSRLSKSRRKYSVTENGDEVVYADEHYDSARLSEKISKTIVVNGDDKSAEFFLSFDAPEKYCYGIDSMECCVTEKHTNVKATLVEFGPFGSTFGIGNASFEIALPGKYNVYNALAAITVGLTRGMGFGQIAQALRGPIQVPGRFERIIEGQDFEVIIDYAPEPASLNAVYSVIDTMSKNRVIHVLGSCGGGRDVARRPIMGEISANHADIVIITNEDPYDDDPQLIIDQIADGAKINGKIENQTLFKIMDRKQAIEKAISMAEKNDIVLITGKGAEQAICIKNGKKIPWDDREIARSILLKKRQT